MVTTRSNSKMTGKKPAFADGYQRPKVKAKMYNEKLKKLNAIKNCDSTLKTSTPTEL